MSFAKRMAESAARGYEDRAVNAKTPDKAQALRAKAAKTRRDAGITPTVQDGAPPLARVDMLDAPTVRLQAVPPQVPEQRRAPGQVSRGSAIRAGVIAGAFLMLAIGAALGLTAGGSGGGESAAEDPISSSTTAVAPTPSRQFTADDRQSCRDAMGALERAGELDGADLSDPGNWPGAQADLLMVAERLQGASVLSDSARVGGALGNGAQLMRRAAGAMSSLDVEEMRSVQSDAAASFEAIGAACAPVLSGGR